MAAMNGNGSGEVKTPATPSSAAAGGRPVYATASTLFTPDPSVGHLLYTMRKVGPKVPPEVRICEIRVFETSEHFEDQDIFAWFLVFNASKVR